MLACVTAGARPSQGVEAGVEGKDSEIEREKRIERAVPTPSAAQ